MPATMTPGVACAQKGAKRESGAAIFLGTANADTPDQRLASHLEQAQAQANTARTFAAISMQEIDAALCVYEM